MKNDKQIKQSTEFQIHFDKAMLKSTPIDTCITTANETKPGYPNGFTTSFYTRIAHSDTFSHKSII